MLPRLNPDLALALYNWGYILSYAGLIFINAYNWWANRVADRVFIGPPKPAHLYD